MISTIALWILSLSGITLLILALVAWFVFPNSKSSRWWGSAWGLAALGCFGETGLPFLSVSIPGGWLMALPTVFLLFSLLSLALGFLEWFHLSPDRGKGAVLRTLLWGGTFLMLIPVVLTPEDEVARIVAAAWALVPIGVAVVLLALHSRHLRKQTRRSNTADLLLGLLVGALPFAVSWIVLPLVVGREWNLGFPPVLAVTGFLILRTQLRFDPRFHRHQAAAFLWEKTLDTVLFLDARGRIQALNPALGALLDRQEESIVGRSLAELGADEPSRRLLEPIQNLTMPDWEGALSLTHRSGRPVAVHLVFRRVHNPAREAVGGVLLLYDLNRHRAVDLSSRLDGLTSLANSRWAMELLEAEFQRVRRYGGYLTVVWFQLVGGDDQSLIRFAGVLKAGLRKTDFAGRMGDQEFLVVLPETAQGPADLVAHRLLALFSLALETDEARPLARLGQATLGSLEGSAQEFASHARANLSPIA